MDKKKVKYHFITGLPRAGTTLLSSDLNKYDDYSSALLKYYEIAKLRLKNRPYTISEEMPKMLKAANGKSIWQNSVDIGKCFSFFNTDKAPSILIDKNPVYTFHLERILAEFPEAKFVLMHREPKAFVFSKIDKKHHKEKVSSPYFFAHNWKSYTNEIHAFSKKYLKKTLLVKYEDLVVGKDEFNKILRFFNIDETQKQKDSFEDKYNNLLSGEMIDRHRIKYADLSKPINTSRLEAYKKGLSVKVQKRIEYICKENMEKLGYKSHFEKTKDFIMSYPYLSLSTIFKRKVKN